MAENPDIEAGDKGKFATSDGALRFVIREVDDDATPMPRQLRILQRYEWSYTDNKIDWYDIHLAKEN